MEPVDPPTLELEGARLRPLRAGDVAAIHAYLRDPAVTERTSYPAVTEALAAAIVEKSARRWAAGEPGKWGVVLDGEARVVGTIGFNDSSAAHRSAELAYELGRAHWGRGIMRAAVAAVLRWTFERGEVDRVQAFVRVDNLRSQGLLERAGFVREGRLRSFRVCRGVAHDFFVYGLLRADWRDEAGR